MLALLSLAFFTVAPGALAPPHPVVVPEHARAQPMGPPRPPPEAVEACEGKEQGAACEVRLGAEDHAGTCTSMHEGELVCMPEHMPPPPQRGR